MRKKKQKLKTKKTKRVEEKWPRGGETIQNQRWEKVFTWGEGVGEQNQTR